MLTYLLFSYINIGYKVMFKACKKHGLINVQGFLVHEDTQVLAWRKRLEVAREKLAMQSNKPQKSSVKKSKQELSSLNNRNMFDRDPS